MAIRYWAEEVADARQIIEKVAGRIDRSIQVDVDGGKGFVNDTFEVTFRKGRRKATAVVTMEACINARTNPKEMAEAFREIFAELLSEDGPKAAFLVTTSGLDRKPLKTRKRTLQDFAAYKEAEHVKWPPET